MSILGQDAYRVAMDNAIHWIPHYQVSYKSYIYMYVGNKICYNYLLYSDFNSYIVNFSTICYKLN